MTGYIYDADGNRVAKEAITSWSCDPSANGFTTRSDYVRDQAGNQLTELDADSNGNITGQHTNVWANGQLIGTYDRNGTHFYLNDWLSTRRVQTDYAGVVEQTCSSLPYGDGETCLPLPTENLFTGKERDAESGNDYFDARYYSSAMGRFLSPDWAIKVAPVPYAKLSDPQTLNLYAYVLNNPLSHRDADGHWIQLNGDDDARKKQLDALKTAVGSKAGAYLYDNTVDGKHYVGILSGGQDGKGPSFNNINAASNKLGGIIEDTGRGASVQFVAPGTMIQGTKVDSIDRGGSPAVTTSNSKSAQIYVTSGAIGALPGNYMSNGRDAVPSLADVISHEFGHVDSSWYHGGVDTNGDAVRMENQTRQSEGGPTRTGHDTPGDVQLGGTQY